jgi:gamma-glutamyltranspeptidase/glutathione hydrolase
MRTRPNAFSGKGVVSSSSIQSSIAGVKILESGGNIVDAAIATSAALCVTQNNLCGLGGDTFVLLKLVGKPVIDLNGSGRAFKSMTIEHFLDKGITQLPLRGKDAVLTVPGLVRAWEDLNKKYGTMEERDLLKYAYDLARNGFPITQNYSESIQMSSKYLEEFENWKSIFMKDDIIPPPGTIFKQNDLADTFESLVSDGFSSFYDGYIGDKIVRGLNELGVEISDEDLRMHRSTLQDPVSTNFNGFRIYETAPNSQAATAILWLNIVESKAPNLTLRDILISGHIAYSQRDRLIADPDYLPLPATFSTKEFATEVSKRNLKLDLSHLESEDRGDTTYFSITDSEGNSVSVIQSNYIGFGSGIVPKGTGIVIQNRGSYFSLDKKHHNSLMPGKRTFHTLCAGMIEDENGYVASLGSMGGDIQPQLHIQLMLGLMKNKDNPQGVIDEPRWAFPYTIYEKPNHFIVESEKHAEEIRKIFPDRKVSNIGFSSLLGHAQITARLNNGAVVGGADPRGDGVSIPVI